MNHCVFSADRKYRYLLVHRWEPELIDRHQQRWLTSPPTLSLECDEAGFLLAADFVILAFEHDATTKDVDQKRSRGLSSGRRLMASDTRPHILKKNDLKCRGPVARYQDLSENQEAYNLPP
jgi:hypothetical protein